MGEFQLLVPEKRLGDKPVLWQPNSAPQMRFLETGAYEALYGGAAGGGKSDALLMGALRYKDHPRYSGLLLRRTFPELLKTLIMRSQVLYPAALGKGASYVGSPTPMWRLPAGGHIYFGHLEHDKSVFQHQSAEYQYIGFDEQTHFSRFQYLYMLSRLRGPFDLPVFARGATNPGGEGHEWVMERYAPWLDKRPEYKGPRARSGQLLHYVLDVNNHEEYVDPRPVRSEVLGAETGRTLFISWDGRDVWAPFETAKAKEARAYGRTFVGAKAADNPDVAADYSERLRALPPLQRAQLKDGDWLARPAAGKFFKAEWFKYQQAPPAPGEIVQVVRRWDFAATEPSEDSPDPDWTRGVKMAKLRDGRFVVLNLKSERCGPGGVEKLVLETAHEDGRDVRVVVPEDPGSAGKVVVARFTSLLVGYDVRAERETGEKTTRAGPLSAQVEAGNVYLLRGPWNSEFVDELKSFPEAAHDDIVDSADGAFNALQPTAEEEKLEDRLRSWVGGVANG